MNTEPTASGIRTTSFGISNIFHHLGRTIWHGIGSTAKFLHTTRAGVIALFFLIFLVLLAVIIICCIRHKNKRKKWIKTQTRDEFTDLPFPDFTHTRDCSPRLFFSITYNSKRKRMTVGVSHGSDLTTTRPDPIDPYVTFRVVEPLEIECLNADGETVMMPPEDCTDFKTIGSVHRTKTIPDTSFPVFAEYFTFPASADIISSKWLLFEVFDFDETGRDGKLGRVITKLNEIELSLYFGVVLEMNEALETAPDDTTSGDLCLVASYLFNSSYKSYLEFNILEMRNAYVPNHAINSRAKFKLTVTVYFNKRKIKTFVSKQYPVLSKDPYFNYTCTARLDDLDIRQKAAVKISIMLIRPPFMIPRRIGHLILGPNSEQFSGRTHWKEIMRQPNRRSARWHTLR